MDLRRIKVGITSRITNRARLGNALLDEGGVVARREVVHEDAQAGSGDVREAPLLQVGDEPRGAGRGVAGRREVGEHGVQREERKGGAEEEQWGGRA